MTLSTIFKIKYLKCLASLALVTSLASCSGGDGGTAGGLTFGDLNLSWTVPTEREDGSNLNPTEISEYRIYYGTESGDYQNQVDVDVASDSVSVPQIPSGTYFVVVTVVDTDGRESLYSSPELVVRI